jgi:transcriptional regulator with XRE-family HTH domain
MNTVLIKDLIPQIGQMLRVYREKKGQNLSEVAIRANISISMLSQIERGKVTPSIETLLGVCESIGFDVVELFRRLSRDRNVTVRHQGGRLKTGDAGATYEQLITSPEGTVPGELLRLEIAPGMTAGLSGAGHEGIEMGYVLSGSAKLTVGSETYHLTSGDSIAFCSHVPHTLVNDGGESFSAIWSAIPPHKDYLEVIQPGSVAEENMHGQKEP